MESVGDAPVRVLIVDDNDLFRTGLAALLGAHSDLEIVAQASGGRMAVRLARELRPSVILMDLRMPDVDGEEATRQIVEADASARVVVLTVGTDEATVARSIRAGACGYLVKGSPVQEIVAALRAAATGRAWLSSTAAGALLERVRREPLEEPLGAAAIDELTMREIEVLRLIARGRANAEIAAELGISVRTAKHHVASVLAKLHVDNRVQAAVCAVRRGLR